MLGVLPCDGCTNTQQRTASPSVDVYVSFEQTIETLRDRLQQSDFDLCRVSLCSSVSRKLFARLTICLSVVTVIILCLAAISPTVFCT